MRYGRLWIYRGEGYWKGVTKDGNLESGCERSSQGIRK